MIMVAVIIQSYCRDDEQETEKGDQKKQQHKQRCPGPRRLKNLALSSVSIDLETMDASFQNVFKNLNSLTMNAVHIKHPPAPARTNSDDPWDFLFEPPPLQQPPPHSIKKKAPPSSSVWKMENNNLRHLTTGSIRHLTRLGICGICDKEQYRLVLDSQHLRSLTWNYHWMKEPYQTLFAQDLHIRSGTNSGVLLWPFLNCLSFQNSQIPDEDLAEILLAMGTERPLRELDAQFTNFGPKSAEALLGGAYKVMDEDDETTGALENMPQEAQSEKVSGSAPEPGNSSSGISTQSLAIATVAATAAVSVAEPWQSAHLFLDRLSLLSGLRDLILSDFRPPSGFHPFRLGLDYDQERLEQLSRSMTLLTRVKWGGHDPKNQAHHVRMWDAHWMAATSWWANLNTIWIHDDIKIKEELKDWLQSRGVRCEDSRKADISG
ncbi:hypothetical protein BGZ83_009035 [Gryganskiella cystojenkinii]|nr:hypothetical protein BGZ83_009035 [Gryganskiella cystojenkinii]